MRSFLRGVAFLCVVLGGAGEGMCADVPLDADLVALFSDLHVSAGPSGRRQREGLARCVREVLDCNPRPAHVLFFGDLSLDHGETNDYRVLKALVRPLEESGVAWHACFGNHDRREPFFAVFPERRTAEAAITNRMVSVVSTPHANFVLLDSCLEGPVGGAVDDAQRAWLRETLVIGRNPMFVGAHHPLRETAVAEVLLSSGHCAGYVYGHNHVWKPERQMDIGTLGLPSTGHWGDIGYVLVKISVDEAVFTLHQFDFYAPQPAARPEEAKAEWRERTAKNNGLQWRVQLHP